MEQELKEGIEFEKQQPIPSQKEELSAAETQEIEEERRARDAGWVPREEYKGDVETWRSAEEWNKRTDSLMPILRATNKRLEGKLSVVEKELASTKDILQRMVKVQDKYSTDFYDTKIAELKTAKLQAVEEGDVERYRKLEEQESKVVRPEPIQSQEKAVHPEVTRWVEENSWFGKDQTLTDYARFIGEQLKNAQDPVSLPGNETAFLQKVKQRMETTFPQKFSNPNRNRQDMDESRLRGGAEDSFSASGKDWNHLPPEAKQQCMKMVKEIPGMSKEKYIASYYEE